MIFTVSAVATETQAEVVYDTVALTGATGTALGLGPDVGAGVEFGSFAFPVINTAGEVAFFGFLTGSGVDFSNSQGIWTNAGGTLAVVAREGSDGPGPNVGAGIEFHRRQPSTQVIAFSPPVLNDAGEVAFLGVTGTEIDISNEFGIWTNVGGTLAAVAREGNDGPGPNLGAGVEFAFNGLKNPPVFNDAGEVAFLGILTGTGVDSTNSQGIWTNAGGTLAVVARSGSDGPGPNVGVGVEFSLLDQPFINAAGEIAFLGRVTGAGVDATNNTGIWTNAGGTLSVAARTGTDGPGPNVGAGVQFSAMRDPAINDAGEVAFLGFLTGTGVDNTNRTGIWTNAGGALAVVARSGSDGPGPNLGAGVEFSGFLSLLSFEPQAFNAAGEVAFRALLNGTGVDSTNNQGIWTNVGGTLSAVARTGSDGPGPGLDPGVHFAFFDAPILNATGEVAFLGGLTGTGVDSTNDQGLWTNAGGSLEVIVREGDLFDVDPTDGVDLRTILSIGFFSGSFDDDAEDDSRQLYGFSDSGRLAFRLGFTDGSSGVFTALIPEPASAALIVLGVAGMLVVGTHRTRHSYV